MYMWVWVSYFGLGEGDTLRDVSSLGVCDRWRKSERNLGHFVCPPSSSSPSGCSRFPAVPGPSSLLAAVRLSVGGLRGGSRPLQTPPSPASEASFRCGPGAWGLSVSINTEEASDRAASPGQSSCGFYRLIFVKCFL